MIMYRSYSECIKFPTIEDRYRYLKLDGAVAAATFGGHRELNQALYRDPTWKKVRREVILRDAGCDLGVPGYEIPEGSAGYIHHINPITIEDIKNRDPKIFDLDNLILCSYNTHQAIHYGSEAMLPKTPIERKPGDTCPWR